MTPDPKDEDEVSKAEVPGMEQQDWDDIRSIDPVSVPENGDLRYPEEEPDGELPEEDDDNPYQESDEALPDDEEEAAISRNLRDDEA